MGHGMFKKNIYVEENAGLREKSYIKWDFENDSSVRLLMYLVFPCIIYMGYAYDELQRRDKQIGRTVAYGVAPPHFEDS